jgi:hypothetical protein
MTIGLGEGVIVSRPNLFEYATSELSQDAFLCWLVAWAGCLPGDDGYDKELHECGAEFIKMLYLRRHPDVEKCSLDVELLGLPKRQYKRTDVFFRTKILGSVVSFIIEDKTGTTPHSNQLNRYIDSVRKVVGDDTEIIGVYLKTHYWFPEDCEASDADYLLVNGKELSEFLHGFNCSNEIFLDYRKSLDKYLSSLSNALADRLPTRAFVKKPPQELSEFERDFSAECQYSFMLKLVRLLRNTDEKEIADSEAGAFLRRGRNNGGTPWTQLDVFRSKALGAENILESVFYRIDVRKDFESGNRLPYICLRQWAPVKEQKIDKQDLIEQKRERLNRYKSITCQLRKKANDFGLKFGRVRNDNKGANESEIAILFLESAKDVTTLSKQLPIFHSQFVEACTKLEGLPEAELTSEESKKHKLDEIKKLKSKAPVEKKLVS